MNPFSQLIDRSVPARLQAATIPDDAPVMQTSARRRIELAQGRDREIVRRRKKAIYLFLETYFERNDQLPSTTVIGREMGVAQTVVCDYMARLGRDGLIERNEAGNWRFVRDRPQIREELRMADARFRIEHKRGPRHE